MHAQRGQPDSRAAVLTRVEISAASSTLMPLRSEFGCQVAAEARR